MTLEMRCEFGGTYEQALPCVVDALTAEGFGVLTEVDMKETLKQKLGVDVRRYKIFGACHPALAHAALQVDLAAGLMMPCNIVVHESDRDTAIVFAVDPTHAAAGHPQLTEIAYGVRARLARVLERVSVASSAMPGVVV